MKLFLAAIALCVAGSANALTITFENNFVGYTSNGVLQSSSNGFQYHNSDVYVGGAYMYLHDDNGITSSTIQHAGGARFSANSLDFIGYSGLSRSGSGPAPTTQVAANAWIGSGGPVQQASLVLTGIKNGVSVASLSASLASSWTTLSFSNAFKSLDSLIVQLSIPNAARVFDWRQIQADQTWCYDWCAGVTVDNLSVDVAPVPLPASGLLLIGALLGLIGHRRLKAH